VTLNVPRKGLKNLFNVQRPWTNLKKIIKFYLQTNIPQTFYPIFFAQRGIPKNYINKKISILVATLYSMSSM
jgi:hypothetical protein